MFLFCDENLGIRVRGGSRNVRLLSYSNQINPNDSFPEKQRDKNLQGAAYKATVVPKITCLSYWKASNSSDIT